MTLSTILTMANGKGVDLNNVTASNVDFLTWSEHIAKEARFNGATPGEVYNVAQHCVLGADAMLAAGATEYDAAEFLIHDLPEGIWKDDPTPKKCTIAARIETRCGVTAEAFLGVLKEIDIEHEMAVHEAAGLPYPIPEDVHRTVKLYDKLMFVTEWHHFMSRDGFVHPDWSPYAGLVPLPIEITRWSWAWSHIQWMDRARRLLPALRTGRAG